MQVSNELPPIKTRWNPPSIMVILTKKVTQKIVCFTYTDGSVFICPDTCLYMYKYILTVCMQ